MHISGHAGVHHQQQLSWGGGLAAALHAGLSRQTAELERGVGGHLAASVNWEPFLQGFRAPFREAWID